MSVENAIEVRYRLMVARLKKPGHVIALQMTGADAELLYMGAGVSGEAGELLNTIKKSVICKVPLDRASVVEKLGDLEFYLEGLRASLGITRLDCLETNAAKLTLQYASHPCSEGETQVKEARDMEEE